MANSLATNPIFIDTVTSAVDVGSTLFGDSNAKFTIQNIQWGGDITVGDDAIITDNDGVPYFNHKCAVADESVSVDYHGAIFKGLKLTQTTGLDGGHLIITLI